MIAIDVRENKKTVLRSIRENRLTYPNLIDSTGETSAIYGVQSTPVKFLIGPDGNMVSAAMGYREWDSKEMISLIEMVIKQGGRK